MKEKRFGSYAWLRPSLSLNDSNVSYFLPLPEEDFGKKEWSFQSAGFLSLVPGMLGIISGGVDPGEEPSSTIIREAWEEQQLRVSEHNVSNGLPKLDILQLRNGTIAEFTAIGHLLRLTPEHLLQLRSRTPVLEIPDEGLERFLRGEKHRIRPLVYQAGVELLSKRLQV